MPTKVHPEEREIIPTRLYTFAAVAKFFGGGVTDRQVRRWVTDGKMAYTPLPGGRGRRISGQQYLDYINDHRVEPEA